MDLENYWQQNKPTLIAIGCGLLLFLIANTIIQSTYGDDYTDAVRTRTGLRNELKSARYDRTQRDEARRKNKELRTALDTLRAEVAFQPRPEFVIQPDLGSADGQYFTRVEEVRERLSQLASRAGLAPPDDAWGIEPLHTNQVAVIERHLEILDVIDRVVRLSLEAGVQRISKIQPRLDARFGSSKGLEVVERSELTVEFDTTSASMTQLFALTQSSAEDGQALCVKDFELEGERGKLDQVKASVTFYIVRLRDQPETVEG